MPSKKKATSSKIASQAQRRRPKSKALKKSRVGRKPARGTAGRGKYGPASKNRGLVIFSVLAGIVLALAVIGKIRQGPPVKLLPAEVLQTLSTTDTKYGELSSPRGLAVDSQGNVFVADLGNNRLVKFSAHGPKVDVWGRKGEGAGEFKEPSGIAVSLTGEVLVADAWNGRIQKFSNQGEYFGEITAATGNFYSPRNVALDSQGTIYVADTGNSCIKKFDSDANLIKRWGEYGNGNERFQETFGLWVDNKDQVYVGDAGNRRIKIFTTDGKYLRSLRVKGWQSGVSWPMMAVDQAGTVYAVDTQHNMVWMYNAQGKYLGSWGNKPGKTIFASPLGVAVDAQGAVYVSNMGQGQIVKLKGWHQP